MFSLKTRLFSASAIAVGALLLASCGGSSSTHTRNELTCAQGGECKLGDTGPSGGPVIVVDGTNYVEVAPDGWNNGATVDPTYTFDQALSAVSSLTIGSRSGWTLPTMSEMAAFSCLAYGTPDAMLSCNATGSLHTENLPPYFSYWTTRVDNVTGIAYVFDVKNGTPNVAYWKNFSDIHLRPVRHFSMVQTTNSDSGSADTTIVPTTSAAPETSAPVTTIPETTTSIASVQNASISNDLLPVENVSYDVTPNAINFHWKNPSASLRAEGYFVLMTWDVLNGGRNSEMPGAGSTGASTRIFPSWYGTRMTFAIESYTNATNPPQIAMTNEFTVNIPTSFDTPTTVVPTTSSTVANSAASTSLPTATSETVPSSTSDASTSSLASTDTTTPEVSVTIPEVDREQPVLTQVLDPTDAVVEVGPSDVTQKVTGDEVTQALSSVVPDGQTLTKVEITTDNVTWTPIALGASSTEVTIPASAKQLQVRMTLSNGGVLTQVKQIVHTVVTAADQKAIDAKFGDSSTPAVARSSNSNSTLWIILFVVLVLLVVIAIVVRRRITQKN